MTNPYGFNLDKSKYEIDLSDVVRIGDFKVITGTHNYENAQYASISVNANELLSNYGIEDINDWIVISVSEYENAYEATTYGNISTVDESTVNYWPRAYHDNQGDLHVWVHYRATGVTGNYINWRVVLLKAQV